MAAVLLMPFILSFLLPVLNSLLPLGMPWLLLLLLLFFTVCVVSQESSIYYSGPCPGSPSTLQCPTACWLALRAVTRPAPRSCARCQPSAAGLLPAALHVSQRLLQVELCRDIQVQEPAIRFGWPVHFWFLQAITV